jgi:hypothetical protein
MSLVFFPGSRQRFKKLYTYNIYNEVQTCTCIQDPVGYLKSGYRDSTQTENGRISQILSNNLGGRTTFGNSGNPVQINYLGRQEGHPGGSRGPLRNKF